MIAERRLPPGALLTRYDLPEGYVDCLEARFPSQVALSDLISAFYNSRAFRPERWLLGAVLGFKAGDADVARLAAGETSRFSAWTVEDRSEHQILLCDFQQRTRSWLMVEPAGPETVLRFGTAVVPAHRALDRILFRSLLWFHRAYARQLLYSAVRQLLSDRTLAR